MATQRDGDGMEHGFGNKEDDVGFGSDGILIAPARVRCYWFMFMFMFLLGDK